MSQITLLDKSNAPIGPFTRAEIAQKLQRGEITLNDYAFVQGLSQWTPLQQVLAHVDGATFTPATPGAMFQDPGSVVYAGFWLRFVAIFLDGLIIGIPVLIVSTSIGFAYGVWAGSHGVKVGFIDYDGSLNGGFLMLEIGVTLFSLTVRWLYFALQESSSAQATVGKRIIGIRVTDLEGNRITFGRASGRFFGKIISGMILCVGYMMAGFTDRKQALHDMMASTLVIRN